MFPIEYKVIGVTLDSMSFQNLDLSRQVEIPLGNHVGAFGARRRHDIHKGIDLYCEEGTEVYAIEDGEIIDIRWFTGKKANCAWWNNTQAITIKGENGNLVYGEIIVHPARCVGEKVGIGTLLGNVTRVLKKDKGRPTTMLHFAIHHKGVLSCETWSLNCEQPIGCVDPTNFLIREGIKE